MVVRSQLHLVDLAGSEQLKKSRAEGQRKAEAVGINSSLMVLGKVIAALTSGRSHVPYNESRLTQLLKGALGGNSRTTVPENPRSCPSKLVDSPPPYRHTLWLTDFPLGCQCLSGVGDGFHGFPAC